GTALRRHERLERGGLVDRGLAQQGHHVLAHGERRERAAVGVDGGEADGEHPAVRLVHRAPELTAEAAVRGREQLERRPGAVEQVGRGGEAAHEQHDPTQPPRAYDGTCGPYAVSTGERGRRSRGWG